MSELFSKLDEQRWSQLDEFMNRYLDSTDRVSLYREYEPIIKSVRPIDLFHLPMFQNDTTHSIEEIKLYANRFVNLFFHGLASFKWNRNASPMLESLIAENEAIMHQLEAIKPYFEIDVIEKSNKIITDFFHSLADIEKKFIKSQMILYPILEKLLPSRIPFKVLWGVEDDLLIQRKKVLDLLQMQPIDWSQVKVAIGHFYYQLAGLIQKEDIIVLPLASEFIDYKTWASMTPSATDIGYSMMTTPIFLPSNNSPDLSTFQIETSTGSITIDQFELMMSHLPIAITYVDEFDRVRYYNQTKERHFPRTPQTIGREVKYCHPEKSIHIVEKILSEFKAGKQSVAQFWMDFKGIKLLISYYAVRTRNGEYKGVIETTQDISQMTDYQGEKRLLDWK